MLRRLKTVKWIGGSDVLVTYHDGRIVEATLPVKSAKNARIVDMGMGLDPGDGRGEFCACHFDEWPQRVIRMARPKQKVVMTAAMRRNEEKIKQYLAKNR